MVFGLVSPATTVALRVPGVCVHTVGPDIPEIAVVVVILAVVVYFRNPGPDGKGWRLTAVLSVLTALTCVVTWAFREHARECHENGWLFGKREWRSSGVLGEEMGRYLARRYPGTTAIVLARRPFTRTDPPDPVMTGLKKGLAGEVVVVDTIVPEIPDTIARRFLGEDHGLSQEGTMQVIPTREWFTVKQLDALLTEHRDVDLLITMAGLPGDWQSSKLVGRGRGKMRIAMVYGYVWNEQAAIADGMVVAAATQCGVRSWHASVEPPLDDLTPEFSEYHYLLTPDNVEEFAAADPEFFSDTPPSQK